MFGKLTSCGTSIIVPLLSSRLLYILSNLGNRAMASAVQNDISGKCTVSYVTTPNETIAKFLAKGLVQRKLAACINIIPSVTSIYTWKGEMQESSEVLMIIKSRASRLGELTAFVKDNHPDEVCEVISTAIVQGNPAYMNWLDTAVPDLPSSAAVKKET